MGYIWAEKMPEMQKSLFVIFLKFYVINIMPKNLSLDFLVRKLKCFSLLKICLLDFCGILSYVTNLRTDEDD